jgi:hypothetical protein
MILNYKKREIYGIIISVSLFLIGIQTQCVSPTNLQLLDEFNQSYCCKYEVK